MWACRCVMTKLFTGETPKLFTGAQLCEHDEPHHGPRGLSPLSLPQRLGSQRMVQSPNSLKSHGWSLQPGTPTPTLKAPKDESPPRHALRCGPRGPPTMKNKTLPSPRSPQGSGAPS